MERVHQDEIRQSIERVERAIAAIRRGAMVILTDDEDRENEGDLVMAATKVTPKAINFMATYGRGLICLTVTEDRSRRLRLPMMVQDNGSQFGTAFTVSIEAAHGVSTGISAKDRALTVKAAVAPNAKPTDLVRPGHVFPLVARDGGVLVRTGQTEGSVDLARMAGLEPAGVICEIMNPDGSMARRADLVRFAKKHGLVLLSVADLIRYRLESEHLVRRLEEAANPVAGLGDFRAVRYECVLEGRQHIALVKGDVAGGDPVLVRMHSACPLGDSGLSAACDCGTQLRRALEQIDREGRGVVVYLQKDSLKRLGCILANPEDPNREVRLRDLGVGAQILRDLGVSRIRLLTNNPKKIVGMHGYGLSVVERVPVEVESTPANRANLRRQRAAGHVQPGSDARPTRSKKHA